MYKCTSIVILVLVTLAEPNIITSPNDQLITSNLVSELKLQIAWESHILDFIQLIDMQKIISIGFNYMSDEEVLNFIPFLSSSQFKEMVYEIESMPEFKEASTYLVSKGYDINEFINYINADLGLPPYQKQNIYVKYRTGIAGLIEDLIESLPLEEFKKLFESKLVNYPEIAELFKTITSEDFLEIIRRLSHNPEFHNYKFIFESYGFDFGQICKLADNIFGPYYQGIFCS